MTKLTAEEVEVRRDKLRKECKDYSPGPAVTCEHYTGNGACKRPDYFMCVVWLKKNPEEGAQLYQASLAKPPPGPAVRSVPKLATEPAHPDRTGRRTKDQLPTQLFDEGDDDQKRPRAQGADVYDLSRLGINEKDAKHPLLEHPELLTEKAVNALAKRGFEVAVNTANGTPVTLLPKYTKKDRCELTYRDARTLVMVLQVFPGATLQSLTKPPKEEAS